MNTTVYYPYITPPLPWLKVASLCWDRVYILNTGGYYDTSPVSDDSEVARFNSLMDGLVDRSIRVEDIVDEDIVAQFKKWVEAREEDLKQKGLSSTPQPLFGVLSSKFTSPDPTVASLRDWLIDRSLARIEEPSDKSKYGYNEKRGWTEAGAEEYVADTMVFLPKDIALHYLSLCAAKAALAGNRDLVAGAEEFTDVIFHDVRAVRGQVSSAVLEAYLPEDFHNIELERLAEFRSEFAAKRLQYEKEIQSIIHEFEDVASEGQLGILKDRIVDLAKERVEETRKAYKLANLQTVLKVFGISLTPPAMVASIASALGVGIFAPAGIAAALSLFAADSLIEWHKARSAKKNSPWSYVLDAAKVT